LRYCPTSNNPAFAVRL